MRFTDVSSPPSSGTGSPYVAVHAVTAEAASRSEQFPMAPHEEPTEVLPQAVDIEQWSDPRPDNLPVEQTSPLLQSDAWSRTTQELEDEPTAMLVTDDFHFLELPDSSLLPWVRTNVSPFDPSGRHSVHLPPGVACIIQCQPPCLFQSLALALTNIPPQP